MILSCHCEASARGGRRSNLALLLLLASFLSDCGPTFSKERLAEHVIELCQREYKQPVQAKLAGRTLGVLVELPDTLFDEEMRPTSAAVEKVFDVLLASARVATSSDADVEFLVITAREIRPAGFEWVLTRNVMDIKRQLLGAISRDEATKRMEMDFNLRLFEKPEEGFAVREITMEDFLGRQIARRLKDHFAQAAELAERYELQMVEGRFEPEGTGQGKIIVSYQARPKVALELSPADRERLAHAIAGVVNDVVQYYQYDQFGSVHLRDAFSGAERVIDRASLKKFARQKTLRFDEQ